MILCATCQLTERGETSYLPALGEGKRPGEMSGGIYPGGYVRGEFVQGKCPVPSNECPSSCELGPFERSPVKSKSGLCLKLSIHRRP